MRALIEINRRKLIFIATLAVLAFIFGYLNRNNELVLPSLYLQQYKRLGLQLLNGGPYNVTYPLWGYPILIALVGRIAIPQMVDILLPVIQLLVSYALILFFGWPLLNSRKMWFIFILFIPVFSFACFRAPDAWVMLSIMLVFLCLRCWAISGRWIWLLLAGGGAALGVNMRSELFFFFSMGLILSLIAFLFNKERILKCFFYFMTALFCGSLIGILGWTLNTYRLTGTPLFTSTNGGSVLYITLGQLPNNPWGRQNDDGEGTRFAKSQGIENQYSLQGNRVLTAAALNDIRSYPLAFMRKVGRNFILALSGGVYTIYDWWTSHLPGTDKFQWIRLALSGDRYELIWAVGATLKAFFRIVFLFICILTVWFGVRQWLFKDSKIESQMLAGFILIYMIFTFAMVSMVQYEPRHLTALYALQVLFIAQVFVNESAEKLSGVKLHRFFSLAKSLHQ